MKKMLVCFLAATLSLPTLADCTNAYEIKAQKRAHVNKVLKRAGVITAIGGATLGGSVLLLASGGAAVVGVPFVLLIGSGATVQYADDIEKTDENTYFKGLASIEAAKKGSIPYVLLDRLDKKMSYYSMSDFEQKKIDRKIIKIILKSNRSKDFCKKPNGSIKPMNFRKFVKLIAKKLNDEK